MARLPKIAYEKFAQFVASGLSLAESYRRTTDRVANADVKGTQWHGYAGIKERIAVLKEQNAQRAQMTREELMAFYAAVIRTPADQVPLGSPVIQAYEMTESGPKIRIADKIAAGAQLSKMTGWNEPDQVRLSGTDSSRRIYWSSGLNRSAGRSCLWNVTNCPWKMGRSLRGR